MEAIVDTGSSYTLIKESAAKRIGGEIDLRRNPPRLQGVTGAPLRILGMWRADIGIGNTTTCQRYLPVVPNSYLSCDVLLGCDVLSLAPLVWDGRKRAMLWGDTHYVVNHIRRQKNKVQGVKSCPVEPGKTSPNYNQINLHSPIKLDPYHTQFVPIEVRETPHTNLLVYPQPRCSQSSHPYLVQVTAEQSIYLPLANPTKKQKIFRKGTIVASYEKVEVPSPPKVNAIHQIHNDLLPHNDCVNQNGTRVQRLEKLIKGQNWQHLTKAEQAELEHLILENDPLFILDEKELGLISGPPAHIKVSDPQPSRGPRYRYPEQAKDLISDMLQDMEDRDIIERSTSAWLSPIVLVNKPDGSKRMCLDYRHVNKHLAADIYHLPRLEELVE